MLGFLLKVFIGFWVIWILWYLTGGPLRDDKSKPFVGFNEQGQIGTIGASSTKNVPNVNDVK